MPRRSSRQTCARSRIVPARVWMWQSSLFLLRAGFDGGLPAFKRGAESVEPRLPVTAISRHPGVELVERPFAQRVETLLSVGAHLHDAGVRQNTQVPRHAGLVDVHGLDDVADGAFPRLHRFGDAKPGRVREGVEQRKLRYHAYTLSYIYPVVKPRSRDAPVATAHSLARKHQRGGSCGHA